ncbi:sugar transferase [Peribacillus simplex]|uniref:Sugar transferase n=2 Tax=Peribacillus simplex TaxID=1478 RepID=A0A9X8ZJ15_9BACI|nr:sugar transferase [Peribacillus simplex]TKH13094.1 sugar transferase [Peribacillus simplex]
MWEEKMKRAFEFLISCLALISCSLLMLFIVILIRLKLGSPVIFKQERPGLNGKPFYLYKFRTMTDEKDDKGVLVPDEKRLTDFGKLLRKLSLDELPQLFNVMKGDVSFVGPRPLLMEYLPLYTSEQARRHDVRPGMTGWAQVNGRNAISWEKKFELDVWYVENQSFLLDMKIIYLTLIKVCKQEAITQEGHVTTRKFVG